MAARTYLDWNAAAPLDPAAREAMIAALDAAGNASSVHAEGRAARRIVETARQSVASLAGVEARDVVFTSGGTEANALALTPSIAVAQDARPCERLLISAVEHASVRAGHRFPADRVEEFPVTGQGIADLAALTERLGQLAAAGIRKPLVSLMAANNETGVVQPVAQAAAAVHAVGGLLHVDATQAPGRMPCTIDRFGADLMTFSAHKLGGPKGVGALVRRSDAIVPEPMVKGGGQERGQRGGTENVAAIAGFGAAAAAVAADLDRRIAAMRALRDRLEEGLHQTTPAATVFGADGPRLPNTTLFAVPGTKAETLLIALDLAGIGVSSGSACSSGKVAPSHVLAAMGVPEALARGAIRVSLGPSTAPSGINTFLEAWTALAKALSIESHGGPRRPNS